MFTVAMIGSGEIIIVMALALLLFGPDKLPEIARQVGTALREVQKMSNSVQNDVHNAFQRDSHLDTHYVASPTYHALPPVSTPATPSETEHTEDDAPAPDERDGIAKHEAHDA